MDEFQEEVLLEARVSILAESVRTPTGVILQSADGCIGGVLCLKWTDEYIGHYNEYGIQLITPLFTANLLKYCRDKGAAEEEFWKIQGKISKGDYQINLELYCRDVQFKYSLPDILATQLKHQIEHY